jgi:ATP adenylyltransferase
VQTIFTPWRYDYLTSPRRDQRCIFCAAAESADPAETMTLYRNDQALVMLNRYPYTTGHLMIALFSTRHGCSTPAAQCSSSLIRLSAEAQRILSDTYHPEGFTSA